MEDLTEDFNYEMESDLFLAIFPVWLVSAMALQKFFPWTGDVCHGHFPWLQWWERQVKPSWAKPSWARLDKTETGINCTRARASEFESHKNQEREDNDKPYNFQSENKIHGANILVTIIHESVNSSIQAVFWPVFGFCNSFAFTSFLRKVWLTFNAFHFIQISSNLSLQMTSDALVLFRE